MTLAERLTLGHCEHRGAGLAPGICHECRQSAAAIVEAAERSGKRLRDMAHGLETDWIATDVEPTLDTRIGDAIDLMHSVDNDLSAALAAAGRPHAD